MKSTNDFILSGANERYQLRDSTVLGNDPHTYNLQLWLRTLISTLLQLELVGYALTGQQRALESYENP